MLGRTVHCWVTYVCFKLASELSLIFLEALLGLFKKGVLDEPKEILAVALNFATWWLVCLTKDFGVYQINCACPANQVELVHIEQHFWTATSPFSRHLISLHV
jgi:hypothetical protein